MIYVLFFTVIMNGSPTTIQFGVYNDQKTCGLAGEAITYYTSVFTDASWAGYSCEPISNA